jgi:hypothetical protein
MRCVLLSLCVSTFCLDAKSGAQKLKKRGTALRIYPARAPQHAAHSTTFI